MRAFVAPMTGRAYRVDERGLRGGRAGGLRGGKWASRGQGRFPVFVTHGNPGSVSHPCPKRRPDDELREKMNGGR